MIERGVKQGDALSCAIFILCIDPLLRNLNADSEIVKVEVKTKISGLNVNYKAGGFADDINVICKGNRSSVQRIFEQYERLTRRSGLTLNADKTEILALHTDDIMEYDIVYENVALKIKTVGDLKICGVWYCNNNEREYILNITDKVEKLIHKIRLWKSRNLTFEGKVLIVKTFGISQLVYVLQVCRLRLACSKEIERIIFGFIWVSYKNDGNRGIDRIKRSILKNKFVEGGLNVTDIECLDRSLKTRQFVRAEQSNHPIKMVQVYCMEEIGGGDVIRQGYSKITDKEGVMMIAQSTINALNAYTVNELCVNTSEYLVDKLAISYAGSINVNTYLKVSKNILIECVYGPLLREGVDTLHELMGEGEIEGERNRGRRIKMVTQAFPVGLRELASSFNEDEDAGMTGEKYILGEGGRWLKLNKVTTKELQLILKLALGKVSSQNHDVKLGIEGFDKNSILKFRMRCKNTKLRHIFFKVISGDIFSKERMCRFGMVDNNRCERCDGVESTKHLLWECAESRKIWALFNEWKVGHSPTSQGVNEYRDMYWVDDNAHVCKVKFKVIQELIQIIRPMGWSIDRIKGISIEIIRIEAYNRAIKCR
jgi:hypothetical protein